MAATLVPTPPDDAEGRSDNAAFRYLCHLVKGLAEEQGFEATERGNNNGNPSDVDLRLGTSYIACLIRAPETSIGSRATVDALREFGYSRALLIALTQRERNRCVRASRELLPLFPIDVIVPEYLPESLARIAADATGPFAKYKVKVTWHALSPGEMAARRAAVAAVLARSLLRLRK